ncbi:sodium channel protein 1 brain-like isoform X5 [Tachypleus tridentatus]|uniref:sodium channel protein 1 brain-like isoform X5 n=1 Tax=Tachypleus tridentatus TaxID=6853 RepID=UPI003FD33E46
MGPLKPKQALTVIFTIEIYLKLLEQGKQFFETGWNSFDILIVVTTLLVDVFPKSHGGLSVLRAFRLQSKFRTRSLIQMELFLIFLIY